MDKREIKFRAWRSDGVMLSRFTLFELQAELVHLAYDCQLMQYTGLKDINSKEIYEGDIVRAVYELTDAGIGVIKWGDEYPAFDFYDIKTGTAVLSDEYSVLSCDKYQFEIVGNVFENPELLEQS